MKPRLPETPASVADHNNSAGLIDHGSERPQGDLRSIGHLVDKVKYGESSEKLWERPACL